MVSEFKVKAHTKHTTKQDNKATKQHNKKIIEKHTHTTQEKRSHERKVHLILYQLRTTYKNLILNIQTNRLRRMQRGIMETPTAFIPNIVKNSTPSNSPNLKPQPICFT